MKLLTSKKGELATIIIIILIIIIIGIIGYFVGCEDDSKDRNRDGNEEEEDEEEAEEEPREDQECVDDLTVSSSAAGDLFTYSFSIKSCSGATLTAYLDRNTRGFTESTDTPSPRAERDFLYQGHPLKPGEEISGFGERAATEQFTRLCVELGGVSECG